jgi:uncharacterized membrane protein
MALRSFFIIGKGQVYGLFGSFLLANLLKVYSLNQFSLLGFFAYICIIIKENTIAMVDAPIAPGADLFLWIVFGLVGFVHLLIIVDLFGKKKKKEQGS